MRPPVFGLWSVVSGGLGFLDGPNSSPKPVTGKAHQRPKASDPTLATLDRYARLSIRCGLTMVAVIIGGSSSVFACPVCFGAEESSMIDGTKLGILALLAITLGVQGAFAGFFFYLRKRAKRMADVDLDTEWSELQRGPSRT